MKNLIFVLFTTFLFSCGLGAVNDLARDEYSSKQIDTDRLVGVGKVKTQGEYVVIGEKYLYLIKSKELNQFIDENQNLDRYRIKGSGITVNLDKNAENKGKTEFLVLDTQAEKEKTERFSTEIELFKNAGGININEAIPVNIPIEIKQSYISKKGNKFLSTVLTPFAFAADITVGSAAIALFIPTMVVICTGAELSGNRCIKH